MTAQKQIQKTKCTFIYPDRYEYEIKTIIYIHTIIYEETIHNLRGVMGTTCLVTFHNNAFTNHTDERITMV